MLPQEINRDGLALKGAGHLMEHSPKGKRILVVLTDASPQDDQSATEGAFTRTMNTQMNWQ